MDLDALAHIFVSTEQNLALNPRFETGALELLQMPPTGVALWSLSAQSGVVSDAVIEGSSSLRLAGGDRAAVAVFQCALGQPVSMAVDIGFATAIGLPQIAWYDAAGNALVSGLFPSPILWPSAGAYPTSDVAALAAAAGYTGVAPATAAINASAPVDRAWAVCQLQAVGAPTTSATFDRVIVSPTPEPLPFFDGDSGACVWTGPRYWSPSQRLGTAAELEMMIQTCAAYWSSDSALVTAQPDPIVAY